MTVAAPNRRRNLPVGRFIVSTVPAGSVPALTSDEIRAGLDVLFQAAPVVAEVEVARA